MHGERKGGTYTRKAAIGKRQKSNGYDIVMNNFNPNFNLSFNLTY